MFGNEGQHRLVAGAGSAVALAVLLAGCASSPQSGDGSGAVAAVIKGLDNPFFQAMESGIEETAAADELDVTVQAAADIADTTGQADRLTTLAGQDFSCFVINPITGTNLVQALAPVAASGDTIVNIDLPLDAEAAEAAGIEVATYIGTDNGAAGGKAGDFVTSLVPAGAQVAIIGGVAGDVTSAARIDGFREAVGDQVEIVQEEAADWRREVALTRATDIIAANPDIKAFFAANDDMGLGIVRAVANAGRTGDIVVVSVDGNEEALQSVADGGLSATVAQYPFAIGQLGVQACQVAAAGETLPAEIESPTALVTEAEAADAIAAFPQPFQEFENPLTELLEP